MKPMLAVEAPKELKFPLYASPKLDGVRCLVQAGRVLSRTLKPIPNLFVQSSLSFSFFNGLDGELVVGSPFDKDVYRRTNSGVMSQDGEPDFTFYVFDYYTYPDIPYKRRLETLNEWSRDNKFVRAVLLEQRLIENENDLLDYERKMLEIGYEGLILRNPNGIYKYGRSTAREGYLLKLKRFTDGEAKIVGFEELMHNGNEAEIDELGHTKRSSHQENLVAMGTLGALNVEDCATGVAFKIGTGYTAQHRKHIWQNRSNLIGSIVKYKHFEIGVKDAPRFPVWLGFRNSIDI